MTKYNVFYSQIKKRLFPLLIVTIASILVNAFLTITLLVKMTSFNYVLYPLSSLTVGVLFLIYQLFANFKLGYSKIVAVIYCLIEVLILTFQLIIPYSNNQFYMTNLFMGIYIVNTLLTVIFTIVSILNNVQISNKKNFTALVITSIFMGLLVAGDLYFFNQYGVYGQGKDKQLIYSWSDDGSYDVSGVIDDNNEVVVIKETFNNAKINKIDSSVINSKNVNTINLDFDNQELLITNIDNLNVDKNVTINAKKELLDKYRNDFYNTKKSEYIKLANSMHPLDVSENEKYIVFNYDSYALEKVDYQILNTWYGKENDIFDISTFMNFEYVKHSNPLSVEDLLWNEANNDNVILDLNGNTVFNVVDNMDFKISFKDIHKIIIQDDNDDIYEAENNKKYIDSTHKYKLSTSENIYKIFDEYPTRDGFVLTWKYGNETLDVENKKFPNDLVLSVVPTWEMLPTRVNNDVLDEYDITYGDSFDFLVDATKASNSFNLKYTLIDNKSEILFDSTSSDVSVSGLKPENSEKYRIIVTTTTNDSSLKLSTYVTFKININKKALSFNWNSPEDNIYSNTDKTISVSHNESELVYGDSLYYSIKDSNQKYVNVKNAGNYTYSVELNGDSANLYSIKDSDVSYSYVIHQKEADVEWSNLEFTYDGLSHNPTAKINGLCDGESGNTTLTYTSPNTNVNTYECRVLLDNDNYILNNVSTNYTINKRPIIITGLDFVKTYDGNSYEPTYELSESIIEGNTITGKLACSGINAGTYPITRGSLDLGNNYEISYVPGNLTINKRVVTVTAKPITVTYGESYKLEYELSEKLISGNNVSGNITSNDVKNAGTYEITIGDLSFGDNYEINYVKATLTINKKLLTINADNQTITYGNKDATLSYTHTELAYSDEFVGNLVREEGNDAGEYNILIGTLDVNENYDITFNSAVYKINPKEIIINWDNLNITYDGNPHNNEIHPTYKDINNNVIDLEFNVDNFTDAGNHDVIVSFKNGETNYILPTNHSKAYSILKAKNAFDGQYTTNEYEFGTVPASISVPNPRFGTNTIKYYSDQACNNEIILKSDLNVGTYYIKVSVKGNDNYSDLENVLSFRVNPKVVSVEWNELELEYTGENQINQVQARFKDISGNYQNCLLNLSEMIEAGTYNLIALYDSENYTLTNNTKQYVISVKETN